jgi:hypothetical protein
MLRRSEPLLGVILTVRTACAAYALLVLAAHGEARSGPERTTVSRNIAAQRFRGTVALRK